LHQATWQTFILPYLEQAVIYNQINLTVSFIWHRPGGRHQLCLQRRRRRRLGRLQLGHAYRRGIFQWDSIRCDLFDELGSRKPLPFKTAGAGR
jgi:hypothetical protein